MSNNEKKEKQFILPPISADILDNLPFGTYIIDKNGLIEYFNPEMVKMAGAKSAKEAIGLNVLTLPTYKKVGLTKYFKEGLKGKPFRIEAVKYTSYLGQKTTIRHYNGIPIKDEKGDVQKLLCIVEDITEQEEMKEKLKESEAQFRDLTENSLVGVYLFQEGKFKYVNPKLAEFFGYKVEELINKKGPQDLTYPEDWPIVEENIRKRMTGEVKAVHYEFRGITKKKEIIYLEVYGSKTTFKGKPAVIGTLIDITKRKKTEEAMKEHLAELERFQKVAVGRELRMVELKEKIKELEEELARRGGEKLKIKNKI